MQNFCTCAFDVWVLQENRVNFLLEMLKIVDNKKYKKLLDILLPIWYYRFQFISSSYFFQYPKTRYVPVHHYCRLWLFNFPDKHFKFLILVNSIIVFMYYFHFCFIVSWKCNIYLYLHFFILYLFVHNKFLSSNQNYGFSS